MSKSNPEYNNTVADRDLYSGLIRLDVLHHAVEGPIFGLGMIEELARHRYRISPGSLYPFKEGNLHRISAVHEHFEVISFIMYPGVRVNAIQIPEERQP